MPLQSDQLEAMLVANVRSYLADYKSGDRVEAERSQALCSKLAHLFSEFVRSDDKWNSLHWVDGFAPSTIKVESGARISLEGYLIGGQQKQSTEWIEPFSATIDASESGNQLRSYRITCGDGNRAFGSVPYQERLYCRGIAPEEWLFTFASTK